MSNWISIVIKNSLFVKKNTIKVKKGVSVLSLTAFCSLYKYRLMMNQFKSNNQYRDNFLLGIFLHIH